MNHLYLYRPTWLWLAGRNTLSGSTKALASPQRHSGEHSCWQRCSHVVAAGGLPLTHAQPHHTPCQGPKGRRPPQATSPHIMVPGKDQFGSPGCGSASCALSTRGVWRRGFSVTLPWLLQAREAQSTGHCTYQPSQAPGVGTISLKLRGKHSVEVFREQQKYQQDAAPKGGKEHSPEGPQLLPPKHRSGSLRTGCKQQPERFSQCCWHLSTRGGARSRGTSGEPPGEPLGSSAQLRAAASQAFPPALSEAEELPAAGVSCGPQDHNFATHKHGCDLPWAAF